MTSRKTLPYYYQDREYHWERLGWSPANYGLVGERTGERTPLSSCYLTAMQATSEMTCCRCNCSGRCRNCSCVRAGKICQGCLPQRLRNCTNTTVPTHDSSTVGLSTTLNSQRVTADPETPAADVDTSFASPKQSSSDVTNTAISWPLPVLEPPNFSWGPLERQEFCDKVNEAYEEVVYGDGISSKYLLAPLEIKAFVAEVARLFQAYADNSSLEGITMKACTIIPILLLQKPSRTSKSKDHASHLQRRLEFWHGGEIETLLSEGRCIQKHLHRGIRQPDDEAIARVFRDLMLQGKTQSALRYLSRVAAMVVCSNWMTWFPKPQVTVNLKHAQSRIFSKTNTQ